MARFTLSVDDGCASDIRVAELAKKYNLETVFYWPVEWHSLAYENGYKPLTYEEAWKISKSFEIGSHTVTHRHLTKIDNLEAWYEISESKLQLEKLFDTQITKFCPPRGYVSREIVEHIYDAGYSHYRLTKGKGLVHIHPNSGANDNVSWRKVAGDMLQGGTLKELWCHSWELDKFNLWEEFEEFLSENAHS